MSVTFRRPTIGPKAYLVRGPSGWVEAFPREPSDRALTALLGTMPLQTALDGFLTRQTLTRDQMEWEMIRSYLAEICHHPRDLIPDAAGVAFWCQAVARLEDLGPETKN